jgi:hypothetical protein
MAHWMSRVTICDTHCPLDDLVLGLLGRGGPPKALVLDNQWENKHNYNQLLTFELFAACFDACDDTGMYRTVRSAHPTYRERESTRIDQVVDPIAHDSINPFWHLSGTQTPRIRVPIRSQQYQQYNQKGPKHLKSPYSVVLPSLVAAYNIE